jgi:hypothetical protein
MRRSIFTIEVNSMPSSRTILPVKVVADSSSSVSTAHSGILAYLELWCAIGMPQHIDLRLPLHGKQGWLTRQLIQALMLLNLLGGESITDIDNLEDDAGLCALARLSEVFGLNRVERRELKHRFRSNRMRTFPAATQLYTFLEQFHHAEEEAKRQDGVAFIPAPLSALTALQTLNSLLIAWLQARRPQKTATLDVDATLAETTIQTAKFCYKGYRAYQPLNVFWNEQQVVLHSEFRDGNVPAGYQLRRVVEESLMHLPEGVETVKLRSDSAGYDTEVLFWCERAVLHPRYGRILFTISADITKEFRQTVAAVTEWTPEYRTVKGQRVRTGREYADVVYVPNSHALQTDIREPFRYIAIREKLRDQLTLPETGNQGTLPFPTLEQDGVLYKISGLVTNQREEDAAELISWHYGRCGKSEEAHSIMKEDFTGGRFPSQLFGANAAWWTLMILTMNLQMVMKRTVLGSEWLPKRMKAVRFGVITKAGRLLCHARQQLLSVSASFAERLQHWRATIGTLIPVPV